MQLLILKEDLEQSKIDALLYFLKSWDIEAEIKTTSKTTNSKKEFSLAAGIWKDYKLNATELRAQAWDRNK
jgi:hypothetical protein